MKAGQKPPNYGRKFPAVVMSGDDLRRLLTACDECSRNEAIRWRNRALIVLLWRCGLRIGEALALERADVDMDAREIHVRKAKTLAGIRVVGFDAVAYDALREWIQNHPGGRWLFVSTGLGGGGGSGARLAYTTANETLKRLARQAGVKRRVHPHGLRHTFASEGYKEGMSLPVLSKALGHKNTEITMHYAGHVLAHAEVVDAMRLRRLPELERRPSADVAELSALAAQLQERLAALSVST
ncbi:MAG: tyrosine-type recombinase/integrase [Solirubrobacteraceae bacterium]